MEEHYQQVGLLSAKAAFDLLAVLISHLPMTLGPCLELFRIAVAAVAAVDSGLPSVVHTLDVAVVSSSVMSEPAAEVLEVLEVVAAAAAEPVAAVLVEAIWQWSC
jgi:hypothetical protein